MSSQQKEAPRFGVEIMRGSSRFIALTDGGADVLTFAAEEDAQREAESRIKGDVTSAKAIPITTWSHRPRRRKAKS